MSAGSLLFRAALDAAVALAGQLREGRPAPAATPYGVADARTAQLRGSR